MRLGTVLKHLSELEQAAADLYEWYAQIFDDIEDAKAFFTKMHKEELAHRDLVDFQRRLTVQSSDTFDEVAVQLQEIKAAIGTIEKHMSEGVFELKDALDFACWLENNIAETHYKTAVSKSNPEFAKLIQALAKGDQNHSLQMQVFAEKMSKSP